MGAVQLLHEGLWNAVLEADRRMQSLAGDVLRGWQIDEACLLAAARQFLDAWVEFERLGPRVGSGEIGA